MVQGAMGEITAKSAQFHTDRPKIRKQSQWQSQLQ